MYKQVHPAENLLVGRISEDYRAEIVGMNRLWPRGCDDIELRLIDDALKPEGAPSRPTRWFRVRVPWNAAEQDYHAIRVELWRSVN